MNVEWKKIIAREGLIILVVLAISGVCHLLALYFEGKAEQIACVDAPSSGKLSQFGDDVKSKYPEYKEIDSGYLAIKVIEKCPQCLKSMREISNLRPDISNEGELKYLSEQREYAALINKKVVTEAEWTRLKALNDIDDEKIAESFNAWSKQVKRYSNNFELAGCLAILLYPIWLVFLFVLWAIRTLR